MRRVTEVPWKMSVEMVVEEMREAKEKRSGKELSGYWQS